MAAGMTAVGGMEGSATVVRSHHPSMEINHAAKHGDVVRAVWGGESHCEAVHKQTYTQLLH